MKKPGVGKLASLPKRRAEFIEPMGCAPVTKLPDGSNWAFEIKLDGYRAVAVKSDRGVDLFSRRHKSFNRHYPHLVEALGELPEGTVVDGEVVALDESGRPNFNLLQNFRSEASHIRYFVFDLLIYQNRDLTRLPLSDRRKLICRAGLNAKGFTLATFMWRQTLFNDAARLCGGDLLSHVSIHLYVYRPSNTSRGQQQDGVLHRAGDTSKVPSARQPLSAAAATLEQLTKK